ncbi:MAG: hypothetical protein QOE93_1121, partial [Actinomycetota bacterium]|nr:hypothetical protein [Actinomycetota bacterium]
MRRTVVAGVVAVLLLAACGGDNEPEGPAGTVPQGIPTTTDPYAVPAVIDEAYVNRVLAGLDHALGEVTRFVIRERAIQPEAIDRLRALYVGDFLELTIASYDRDIQNDFDGYRDEPGDRMTSLTRIMTA